MGLGAPDRLGLTPTLPKGVEAEVNPEFPGAGAALSERAFQSLSRYFELIA